jgi:hypothetical protein
MAWPQGAVPVTADSSARAIDVGAGNGWYWRLKEDLSAASQARDLTWEALARLGLKVELIDDGVAIVAELVANAVMHGRPPIELQLLAGHRQVRLLVVDCAPGLPVWGSVPPESVNGRGLSLVSAYSGGKCGTAATVFRSVPDLPGKAVWAVLPRQPGRLAELEPAAAAHLLQRWLARRGLRDVTFRHHGGVALVSAPAVCSIWCLPDHIAVRTEDAPQVFGYRVFARADLPDVLDYLVQWSTAAGARAGAAALATSSYARATAQGRRSTGGLRRSDPAR